MNGRTTTHNVQGMIAFANEDKMYTAETKYIVRVTSDQLGDSISIEDPRLNLMFHVRLEGELKKRLTEVFKYGRYS